MLGVLLVDKPIGITSHDVVNDIRRRFGTKRVGHAGTLDPLATGLLVVAVGPATRFLQYLPLEPKVYDAEIAFGHSTPTYDAEGELSAARAVPKPLADAIEGQLVHFRGLIQQLPPMFSAIKVGGKPLYKFAREGKEQVREPRTVHIDKFQVLSTEGDRATVRISCSGGTYVRSLANDLGEALNCGGYLTKLVRTHVGRFSREDATPLDQVRPDLLIPLREALPPMPLIQLDEVETASIREGRPIVRVEPPTVNLVALLDPKGDVFSVARVVGNLLQPECVIPIEAAYGAS